MSRAALFTLAAGTALAALLLAERKRPLRKAEHPALRRNLRNLAMGASCAVVVAAVEEPLARRVARRNLARGHGFAQRLPRPLRLLGGIVAMDYGFYWWHVATHRVPFLWRFHRVHHVDPDMDVSTAVRFHALDMLVSLPWRLVQVRLAGVSPKTLRWWRRFFNASIAFHHSNLRLPGNTDALLARVLTTPGMHGIHHSRIEAEQDSNYTSGLAFWDRLHGTFRAGPGTNAVGVDDDRAEQDTGLPAALAAPFRDNTG